MNTLRLASVTVENAAALENVELEVIRRIALRMAEWAKANDKVRLILRVGKVAPLEVGDNVKVGHFKVRGHKGAAAAAAARAIAAEWNRLQVGSE